MRSFTFISYLLIAFTFMSCLPEPNQNIENLETSSDALAKSLRDPAILVLSGASSFQFQASLQKDIIKQGFTLSNSGTSSATAVSFAALAAPFSIESNSCPSRIRPSQSCSFVISYNPATQAQALNEQTFSISYYDGFKISSTVKYLSGSLAEEPAPAPLCQEGATQSISCTLANTSDAKQDQICQNNTWQNTGSCYAVSCATGYELQNATCVAVPQTLTVPLPFRMNINGDAVSIADKSFYSEAEALNFGVSLANIDGRKIDNGGDIFSDAGATNVFNSVAWSLSDLQVNAPITNGQYTVYLLYMEDHADYARKFNILLENNIAAQDVGSLPLGEFKRYGPYQVSVTDGELNIILQKVSGGPQLMGVEILSAPAELALDLKVAPICQEGATQSISCSLANATDAKQDQLCQNNTWVNSGSCYAVSCASGYELQNATCVAIQQTPTVPLPFRMNINGDAVSITDKSFYSEAEALNFGVTMVNIDGRKIDTGGEIFSDVGAANVFNSVAWSLSDLQVNAPITNGQYTVYLLYMEDHADNARKFNILLENNLVAQDVGSLLLGEFKRYGPYQVSVADGELNIMLQKVSGGPQLMGVEILSAPADLALDLKVQATTDPVVTAPSTNMNQYVLPTQAFNVLDYGLKGDGVTDDSAALKALASNTNVTNWYFPEGKTFRLSSISVPAHVDTLYGGGTIQTIMNATDNRGAFHNITTTNSHTLYDGLNFTWENKRIDTLYGAITFGNSVGHKNIEIRNCTFTGNSNASHNAMLLVGNQQTGGITNVWVHNNQFINIPRASIEVLGRNSSGWVSKDDGSVNNINIYENTFDATNANNYGWKNGWHCAVSFSSSRGGTKVYNNRLINNKWDFEVSDSKDVEIFNNYATGTKQYFLLYNQNATGLNNQVANPVHHNHFESNACFYGITIEGANGGMPLGDIYENYIKGGPVWLKEGDGGILRNNTIVKDLTAKTVGPYSAVIKGDAGNTEGFEISGNEIYVYGSNTAAISNRNGELSTSSTQILNNNIYSSGTGCITMPGATSSNNGCLSNWTGTIPSSRINAGLNAQLEGQ